MSDATICPNVRKPNTPRERGKENLFRNELTNHLNYFSLNTNCDDLIQHDRKSLTGVQILDNRVVLKGNLGYTKDL